jgi:hypothetical protein
MMICIVTRGKNRSGMAAVDMIVVLARCCCCSLSPRSLRMNKKPYPEAEVPKQYNFLHEFPECDFGPTIQACGPCYAYGPIKAMSHRL